MPVLYFVSTVRPYNVSSCICCLTADADDAVFEYLTCFKKSLAIHAWHSYADVALKFNDTWDLVKIVF